MGASLSEFSRQVLAAIRDRGWLAPGARWVAAVSGGPDSTALAAALAAALAELSDSGELRLELALAHFDHAIRPDSARDTEWVERLAKRLGAAFIAERGDVPALREREGLTLEEAARNARMAFLERAARSFGARYVATGHTADDQAETVLFRILRGTGIKGLAGIPAERPISPGSPDVLLVRPMLALARDDVLAYLGERGLEYLTDPTNRDTAGQARARIRHEVLPALQARFGAPEGFLVPGSSFLVRSSGANNQEPGTSPSTKLGALSLPKGNQEPPSVRSSLLALARSAAEAQASLAVAAGRCLDGVEIKTGEARLPLWLLTLPPALRTEVFAQAAERLGAPLPIPRGGLARAAAVLQKTAVGARAEARGLVAERGYDAVTLRARLSAFGFGLSEEANRRQLPGWSVPVAVPGEAKLPAGKLVARVVERREFDFEGFLKTKTPFTEVFNARLFDWLLSRKPKAESPKPVVLVCRTRSPGDRFRPFGSAGTKKLKAFLIDRKLPRAERDTLPLLVLERFLVPGSSFLVQELATEGRGPEIGDRGAGRSNQEPGTRNQELVLWAIGLRLSESARVPPDAERLVVMEYVPEEGQKDEG